MDHRAIIFFWLHRKPSSIDYGNDNVARMRKSTYNNDVRFSQSGWVNRRWGNPYEQLELWIDIDTAISTLTGNAEIELEQYVYRNAAQEDWEKWAMPHAYLKIALDVAFKNLLC